MLTIYYLLRSTMIVKQTAIFLLERVLKTINNNFFRVIRHLKSMILSEVLVLKSEIEYH